MDSTGQPVLLRGGDFRGYHFGDQGLWKTSHSEHDYQNFRSWGFNVVRLLISWSKIEPKKGVYDDRYLAYVDRDIQWARKNGVYIVLDMHQWNWNAKWGGNGAPDWAVIQYPATKQGQLMAVMNFWQNTSLRVSFVNMWKHVAQRYANESTIAGYDILNEPWVQMFDDSVISEPKQWAIIENFYEEAIHGIRSVDSNHIIFVEPYKPDFSTLHPLNVSNLVWSPHFYPYVYDYYGKPYSQYNVSILEKYLKGYYDKFVVEFKQPIWIGEFGIDMWVIGSGSWVSDSVQLFAKYQVGWAWWAYWKSDDPTTDMYLLAQDGSPRWLILQFLVHPSLTPS